MTTLAWIILTPAQAAAAVELNTESTRVEPREIDNPAADGLGVGTLVGQFVLPARLLADPDYAAWRSSLGSLPNRTLASTALFRPADDT
jgi:hypothetical protein